MSRLTQFFFYINLSAALRESIKTKAQPLWPPSCKDKRPQIRLCTNLSWLSMQNRFTKAQYKPFIDRATSHRLQFKANELAMKFRTSRCDVTDYASV